MWAFGRREAQAVKRIKRVTAKMDLNGFTGLGGRPRSPMTTCFGRTACASRMCDKSAEGMGIGCIGSLGVAVYSVKNGFEATGN